MPPGINVFISALCQAGFNASAVTTPDHTQAVHCYYKNNPDGTIRWIWPAHSTHPDFLRFYHSAGFRAKLFAFLIRTLFRMGLKRWFSDGQFCFFAPPVSGSRSQTGWLKRWAFFTGTTGPNQKSILWQFCKEIHGSCFTKIAHTSLSRQNLAREAAGIKNAESLAGHGVELPEVILHQDGILMLSDISEGTRRINQFRNLPAYAAQSWLTTGLQTTSFRDSFFAAAFDNAMGEIEQLNDPRVSPLLVKKICSLGLFVSSAGKLTSAFAHGDFTPWNIMVKGESLYVIDWELCHPSMPVLFDLFHFIYQQNILIRRRGYTAIREELDQLFNEPQWKNFLQKHHIDPLLAEQQYLAYITAYYLNVYRQQKKWHTQVTWLLHTWDQALTYHLSLIKKASARKLLLKDLGDMLAGKNYSLLKWQHGALEDLPLASDLDLCITRKDAGSLLNTLKTHPLVSTTQVKRFTHMHQVRCILTDGSLMHIDLIFLFRRKSVVFFEAEDLLSRSVLNKEGLRVPAAQDDFTYTWLFYLLNGAGIPEKHQALFAGLNADQQEDIRSFIRSRYISDLTDLRSLSGHDLHLQQTIMRLLNNAAENRGFRKMRHRFCYMLDVLKRLLPSKGYIITFSGVDGAGKSTVIEHTRTRLEKVFREKVIVLRHRPSILPILSAYRYGKLEAEKKAASTLPRQGRNRNTLSSLLRFAYYYTDYLLGQFYIQVRYVWRGYIVLYDRYYFDFINDGRRSNIHLPAGMTRWLYHFLLKPRLNFFLYADPELILQRKQELEPLAIRQLTEHYLDLFQRLNRRSAAGRYIPVQNEQLPDTLNVVFNHIQKQVK